MINYHPTQQQLFDFVEGDCAPAVALFVSAHCDMCSKCRNRVSLIQSRIGEMLFDESDVPKASDASFGSMLNDIMALPKTDQIRRQIEAPTIELDGRKFKLPRALGRYVEKTGNWSHLLGNLWQAPVDLGPIGKANFVYMQKGGRVPEHTHKGTEMTLVIDGEFSDGIANYDSGDIIFMSQQNTHAPHSEASEGCLVFAMVDAPLHFTSGVARLLNPFSHLFF